jgi:hypothetical protein
MNSVTIFKGLLQSIYVRIRIMDAIVPLRGGWGNLESLPARRPDKVVIAA